VIFMDKRHIISILLCVVICLGLCGCDLFEPQVLTYTFTTTSPDSFFTQAINETEAKAEAEYAMKQLQDYELQMPIAVDIEDIDDGVGRMDNLSVSQRSRNAAVFCQTLKDAGYDAMIYCNMYNEAYKLELELLSGFPIWYADYSRFPQTPYHFDMWQFTSSGKVDGIQGNIDLNIQMLQK